jgi:hypothetical protein
MACAADAQPHPAERTALALLGGHEVRDGAWRSVVALGSDCSGVIVHPALIIYAGHCGTQYTYATLGETAFGYDEAELRRIPLERCEAKSDEAGSGADIAFCWLSEPLADIDIPPIAPECAYGSISVGSEVTLVGFGEGGEVDRFGTKRAANAQVIEVNREMVTSTDRGIACHGDSGGGVFIDRGALPPQLVGIISSGTEWECAGSGTHSTLLRNVLPWIEARTRLDLTPCEVAETGVWAPKPRCEDLLQRAEYGDSGPGRQDAGSAMDHADAQQHLEGGNSGCDPLPQFALDTEPPTIAMTGDAIRRGGGTDSSVENLATWEVRVVVDAHDGPGAGIRAVEARASNGQETVFRISERAPYEFTLPLTDGSWSLVAHAVDFSGNAAKERMTLRLGLGEGGGSACSLAAPGASRAGLLDILLLIASAYLRRLGRTGAVMLVAAAVAYTGCSRTDLVNGTSVEPQSSPERSDATAPAMGSEEPASMSEPTPPGDNEPSAPPELESGPMPDVTAQPDQPTDEPSLDAIDAAATPIAPIAPAMEGGGALPMGEPGETVCATYVEAIALPRQDVRACTDCTLERGCPERQALRDGECASTLRCAQQFCSCDSPECADEHCGCIDSCMRDDQRAECWRIWNAFLRCETERCEAACR